MKSDVATAIEELKKQFPSASFTVTEDGQGGARVIMEPISIGSRFEPTSTWVGFHIPPTYPYADLYPMFIGAEVQRAGGAALQPPLTRGPQFQGRPAIQISRRNGTAQTSLQKATSKVLKVLDFLEHLQ
jgi:hypothetical protein